MVRILIGVALIAIVIGIGMLVLHPKPTIDACRDLQPRIVAFGDSLVAGYGATTEGGFVTMLGQAIGVPITNLGRNGDTTARGLARVDAVAKASPNITLLLLGGNDALQKVPQGETEQNLSSLIEAIQESGSRVILIGVIGGFPDPYGKMYARLAEKYHVTYVSNILSGLIGHEDLMSDSVHPNEAGYQKVAARLVPVVEGECGDI
jgi:acyl-CoA thioesterase-1